MSENELNTLVEETSESSSSTEEAKKAINLPDLRYVKKYIDEQVAAAVRKVVNGDVTAANASSAEFAEKDADGKKINETYLKKSDSTDYVKQIKSYGLSYTPTNGVVDLGNPVSKCTILETGITKFNNILDWLKIGGIVYRGFTIEGAGTFLSPVSGQAFELYSEREDDVKAIAALNNQDPVIVISTNHQGGCGEQHDFTFPLWLVSIEKCRTEVENCDELNGQIALTYMGYDYEDAQLIFLTATRNESNPGEISSVSTWTYTVKRCALTLS